MATQKADKWLFAAAIAIVLGVAFVYAQEQKRLMLCSRHLFEGTVVF
jgi:hypothetical protein